jgi:NRAMP (natural resistance-associated macrophage protein)-like metal ion transporter
VEREAKVIEKIKKFFRNIGPGLITAAVVLGPGSVSAISTNGSIMGTRLLWWVALSGTLMLVYTILAAKFGAFSEKSFLTVVAVRYGRWLAVLIGICSFIVCAGFQCGNNIGVGMSMNAMFGGPIWFWAVFFTALSILFLYIFQSLYQALEKLMTLLVILMIVAFFSNLTVAGPDPVQIIKGFIPHLVAKEYFIQLSAIFATTFSVIAALFQAYLVQERNWKRDELGRCMRDSMVGIGALTFISMIIMITSATVLASRGITVKNAGDMAIQLEPLLGKSAKWLFCLGLWGASFSSFLGNAVIGGTLLSDGLGIGGRVAGKWARLIAIGVMLIGMTVAVLSNRFSPIKVIIVAQATTIITVPLACFMIFWLANKKEIVGEAVSRWWVKILALLGLVAVCLLSIYTLIRLTGL